MPLFSPLYKAMKLEFGFKPVHSKSRAAIVSKVRDTLRDCGVIKPIPLCCVVKNYHQCCNRPWCFDCFLEHE